MSARDRNSARYRLDGDLIRCRACGRGHLVSKAGESFVLLRH